MTIKGGSSAPPALSSAVYCSDTGRQRLRRCSNDNDKTQEEKNVTKI
jgi:hypothetical protein